MAWLAFGVGSIALVVVAFLRGNYLLGFATGVVYAIIAAGFAWLLYLLARAFTQMGIKALVAALFVILLAIPVGYVLTFPAAINPDIQYFIDDQATDRTVRAELKRVFKSDPAFSGLSISTIHVKVVNVTIHGRLPTRSDLERLRERILTECPTLPRCPLHWDIQLRDSGERLVDLDDALFPSDEDLVP